MSIVITASLVKELRERTGAGMMECKRALVESEGNIDAAIEAMRKSGQAKADKKAGRITAEGLILVRVSEDRKQALMLEINSETDFVARDSHFVSFANAVADAAMAAHATSLDTVLSLALPDNQTVEEARQALVVKIGENIQVRRYVYLTSSHQFGTYVHGGRIAALVEFDGGDNTTAKDIAMHIVASNPLVVKPADVSTDIINKEKEIFSAQALSSGKPANIIEKMVEGRVKKFLDEVSLTGQPFVKDPEKITGDILKTADMTVYRFERFAVGEGIEKKAENFAEEVMAQIKGG